MGGKDAPNRRFRGPGVLPGPRAGGYADQEQSADRGSGLVQGGRGRSGGARRPAFLKHAEPLPRGPLLPKQRGPDPSRRADRAFGRGAVPIGTAPVRAPDATAAVPISPAGHRRRSRRGTLKAIVLGAAALVGVTAVLAPSAGADRGPVVSPGPSTLGGFVKVRKGGFFADGRPWSAVGFNDYRLAAIPGGYVCDGNAGAVSDDELGALLDRAAASGATTIRTWFFQSSWDPDGDGSGDWSAFDRIARRRRCAWAPRRPGPCQSVGRLRERRAGQGSLLLRRRLPRATTPVRGLVSRLRDSGRRPLCRLARDRLLAADQRARGTDRRAPATRLRRPTRSPGSPPQPLPRSGRRSQPPDQPGNDGQRSMRHGRGRLPPCLLGGRRVRDPRLRRTRHGDEPGDADARRRVRTASPPGSTRAMRPASRSSPASSASPPTSTPRAGRPAASPPRPWRSGRRSSQARVAAMEAAGLDGYMVWQLDSREPLTAGADTYAVGPCDPVDTVIATSGGAEADRLAAAPGCGPEAAQGSAT